MADIIHCIKKTLRLKPAEAEVLASKAAEVGMCEVGYLRLLITQKPYDYPETRKLLKKSISSEKGFAYSKHAKIRPLFDAAEIKGLQACGNCFQRGDMVFK